MCIFEGSAGTYGNRWSCDAPNSLVSLLPKFNLTGTPDFVVWTGDNARHDSDPLAPRTASDIYRANVAVASTLRTLGVPLIPSIGNNDVYPHDQLCMTPNDPNLGNLSQIWAPFIPSSQMSTFQTIGSYWTQVGNGNTVVVSLNSMAMFKKNKCGSGCHTGGPGDGVLSWLHEVLKMAKSSGAAVIISGHIPPVSDYWHNKCIESYSALATKYGSTIVGHMFAHTHQDNYAILLDPTTGASNGVINIAPSGVSTYNPSIRQYFYDTGSGLITDYTQYYSNITQDNFYGKLTWKAEYTWRQAYGYGTWSINNWVNLDSRIGSDPNVKAQYLKYRYVSSGMTQFTKCTPALAELGHCVLHLDKHHNHD